AQLRKIHKNNWTQKKKKNKQKRRTAQNLMKKKKQSSKKPLPKHRLIVSMIQEMTDLSYHLIQ
ncbi:MAG: hypothetical protein NTZ85_00130, partial [Bacteroidia bacterium]|nr:hypothetical protein [Bacteroidia bacterium]